MELDTYKLAEDQLKSLPKPLQRAIAIIPWRNSIASIAKAQNLNEEQSKNLETETMLIIYGFENQNDFINNIEVELSLEISAAINVANEVENQVFKMILDKANELNNAEGEQSLQSENLENSNSETTTLVPTVIAEKQNDLPMVVAGERPFDSAQGKPLDSAQGRPKTALTFEERKKLVPNIPDNKSHYEGGVDPYREQF